MVRLRFFAVLEMPAEPLPNSFYFVLNDDRAESWLTSSSGEPKKMGNTEMIRNIVEGIIGEAVLVSQAENNRIELKPDGLYVKDDLDPDPLPFYILAKG